MVEGENQQQVGALNKGDIYLSEEELLLNDIRIFDFVFIRRKRKKKKKPNLVLRENKFINCKDYNKIELSKFDP